MTQETVPTGETSHAKEPPYVMVWVLLAVLTAAEISVAFLQHWSKLTVIIVLVLLAVWKALLVAMYYMHLRFEKTRVRILALAPLPLAVILVMAVITEYVL
ncbi:MAG: cytochrome C oxidase subunit IV family protein [Gemmatimonadales bacterium]